MESTEPVVAGYELLPALLQINESEVFVLRATNSGGEAGGEIVSLASSTSRSVARSGEVWRFNPAAVWTGEEVLLVGGSNGPGIANLVLAYSPKLDSWRTLDNPPSGISDTELVGPGVWTGEEMLLYRIGLAVDPTTSTWRELSVSPLGDRMSPVASWTGDELIVWGGCDSTIDQCDDRALGLKKDGAIYSLAENDWRPMAASPLQPGVDPSGVLIGRSLYVFAGLTEGESGGSRYAMYDIDADKWRSLPETPLSPRRYAIAASLGGLPVLWGGSVGDMALSDGAVYDPETEKWFPLPNTPPAWGRDRHSSLSIGDDVFIAGGFPEGPHLVIGKK